MGRPNISSTGGSFAKLRWLPVTHNLTQGQGNEKNRRNVFFYRLTSHFAPPGDFHSHQPFRPVPPKTFPSTRCRSGCVAGLLISNEVYRIPSTRDDPKCSAISTIAREGVPSLTSLTSRSNPHIISRARRTAA